MLFILFVLLLVGAAGLGAWFFVPVMADALRQQRANYRIEAIAKRTKRDMDALARRQRRGGW